MCLTARSRSTPKADSGKQYPSAKTFFLSRVYQRDKAYVDACMNETGVADNQI